MQGKNPSHKTHLNDVEMSTIKDIDFFDGLSESEIDDISCLLVRSEWTSGSILFHKGDQATSMHFVVNGFIKVCNFSRDGKELISSIKRTGDYFGEIAFLGASERIDYAVTLTDCTILTLYRNDWIPFLREKPNVALSMLQMLSLRLRQRTQLLEEITFCKGSSRLARRFLRLADSRGKRTVTGVSIDMPLSQQQIGDMVGLTRESINKFLVRWRRNGYITWRSARYTITDIEKLTEISAGEAI